MLLCGLVAAPAVWLYYARRPRARPSLFVQTDAAKPGYFRIGPYEDIDKDRRAFHRADGEHERVLNWILRQAGVPLYLTGDSGSGKSSLLQAFVIPALREAGWSTKLARALGDPEAALRRAVGANPEDTTDTHALLARAARKAKVGLVLVLDQFEEFVILQDAASSATAKRFRVLLDQLATVPVPKLRLLLVLRSDYQALIERMGLPPLRHDENWRQVGRFGMADARAFLAASGLCMTEQDTDRMLTGAANLDDTPGLVRPVTLNMIGFVLATGRAVWREHTAADTLIRSYIRDTIRHPAIRAYAARLLRCLVSAKGTKRSSTLGGLAAATGIDSAQARNVLLNLQAAGLVRPLGEAQEMWEVSHDFLAQLLGRELVSRRTAWWPTARDDDAAEAQRVAEAQARAALADLGMFIRETPQGLELIAAPDVSDTELRRSKPFLALFAPRLTRASISGSADSDSRFWARMKRSRVKVSDCAPFSGLMALQSLDLSCTEVSDLVPLSGLLALRTLNLRSTKVADLTPLSVLGGLQSLNLSSTNVTDLSPLSGLKCLWHLDVSFTRTYNLVALSSVTALQSLDIQSTDVSDLAPISVLASLQSLNVQSTRLMDVAPVSRLTALQSLNLSWTNVADLEPLFSLASLQSLNLSRTKATDLTPLSHLTALQSLNLSDTQPANLAPLSGLKALQTFSFHRARIDDFSPLAGLTSLQSLDLCQASIVDLTPLSGLTSLQSLTLFGTRIRDLMPLCGLHALKSLDISQTRVADLTPLSDLVALRSLGLAFAPITDLTPVSKMRALKSLDLGFTKVTDLAPLHDLPVLGQLRPPDVSPEEMQRFRQIRVAKGLPVPSS